MKYKARIHNTNYPDEEYDCEVIANSTEEAVKTIRAEMDDYFGDRAWQYRIGCEVIAIPQLRIVAQAMTMSDLKKRIYTQVFTLYKHILCLRYSIPREHYNAWINELANSYGLIFKNKGKQNKKPFSAEFIQRVFNDEFDSGIVRFHYKRTVGEGEVLLSWKESMHDAVCDDITACVTWYAGREIEEIAEIKQYLRTVYPQEGTK